MGWKTDRDRARQLYEEGYKVGNASAWDILEDSRNGELQEYASDSGIFGENISKRDASNIIREYERNVDEWEREKREKEKLEWELSRDDDELSWDNPEHIPILLQLESERLDYEEKKKASNWYKFGRYFAKPCGVFSTFAVMTALFNFADCTLVSVLKQSIVPLVISAGLVATLALIVHYFILEKLCIRLVNTGDFVHNSLLMSVAGVVITIAGFKMANYTTAMFSFERSKMLMAVFSILLIVAGAILSTRCRRNGILVMEIFEFVFYFFALKKYMPPIGKFFPAFVRFLSIRVTICPSLLIYIGLASSVLTAVYFLVDKKIKIAEVFLAIGTIAGFVGITQLWYVLRIPFFWQSQLWLVLLVFYVGKLLLIFGKKKGEQYGQTRI